jgi:peptide/nickel transport system substrate-binding protein
LLSLAIPALARTRPAYGGVLRVEVEGDPWQRPGGIARRLVFDGLTTLGTDGDVRPALAVEWQPENNFHRWQFRLRPGVQFHDGSPLTSIAVVDSLKAACAVNCPWNDVRAVGASVVFVSDSAMPHLPALLAGDADLIGLTVTSDGRAPTNPVGTGPFQMAGFGNGVLTLTANNSDWHGRPFVDSIEIRSHRSVQDQWLDLNVGRADVVEVPAEQLRAARQARMTVLESGPASLLALQVADTGPLANPNLRAAIAWAVDRSALSNAIFQKAGQITGSLLPQDLTGYSFLFSTDRDVNKARELRGGLTPPTLTLAVQGNRAMDLAAQRIALNLREAGFAAQVLPAGTTRADLILSAVSLDGGDPGAMLESLLRNAGAAPVLADDSPATLFQVERQFLDRRTSIPLLFLPRAYAVSSRVRDLHLGADGSPDLANASLSAGAKDGAP